MEIDREALGVVRIEIDLDRAALFPQIFLAPLERPRRACSFSTLIVSKRKDQVILFRLRLTHQIEFYLGNKALAGKAVA